MALQDEENPTTTYHVWCLILLIFFLISVCMIRKSIHLVLLIKGLQVFLELLHPSMLLLFVFVTSVLCKSLHILVRAVTTISLLLFYKIRRLNSLDKRYVVTFFHLCCVVRCVCDSGRFADCARVTMVKPYNRIYI